MSEEEKILKEDVRTIRTKRDLANALEELLQEKNFDEIAIKDITDAALISKNTFYNNFNDKVELLNMVFERYREELMEKVKPILDSYKHGIRHRLFRGLVEVIVHFFYCFSLPIQKMVQNDESKSIYWAMTLFIQSTIREAFNEREEMVNSKLENNISSLFYSGAVTSLIYFGFRDGMDVKEEEIVKNIIRLTKPVIH
ncbi:MAG: TetR/AcrR family transcriptional regulator [Bacilli bacterium]|nr:TetR/AcrR family transcriptional regulator [Bacilli bacterium]